MSNFSEPSVTLCGFKSPIRDTICCKVIDDGITPHLGPHVEIYAVEVFRKLGHTFTPCKWLNPPPKFVSLSDLWNIG